MESHGHVIQRSLTVLIILLAGCTSGSRVTDLNGLRAVIAGEQTLRVLTRDSLYTLDNCRCTDSTLEGVGEVRTKGGVASFAGTIRLADISYLEGREKAGFRTVLAVFAGLAVVESIRAELMEEARGPISAAALMHEHDPRPKPRSGSGGGGGSCPTIYAWNGERDVLQGEAFAVAWGRALSMSTTTPLPALAGMRGPVRITIRNERPETHYHDALEVLSAVVPESARTVIDTHGHLLVVDAPAPAIDAMDDAHRSVGSLLAHVDRRSWHSSLRSAQPGGTFQDRLTLRFEPGPRAERAVLTVTAMNTDIFPVMLSYASAVLGDHALEFVRALEEDPEMIELIRGWLEKAALRVMVGDGDRWVEAGRIYPEASMVPFTRALVVDLTGCADTVHVRLECLADVWTLDAVALDRSAPRVIPWQRAEVSLSSNEGEGSIREPLERADGTCVVTLPGREIRVAAHASGCAEGGRREWGVRMTGYLHEWMPAPEGPGFPSITRGSGRVDDLKALLRHAEILLPPIYAGWQVRK